MKKIYLLLILAGISTEGFSQYAGRSFVRGNGLLNIANSGNRDTDYSYSELNFGLSLSKGTFVTENRVSGFFLSGGLSATGGNYLTEQLWGDKGKGINGYSAGIGKFWQFYKHINENWGLYGEPSVGLAYSHSRNFNLSGESTYRKTHAYELHVGLSLSAGAYYKLSEKWWINGSIAITNPVNLSFGHRKEVQYNDAHVNTDQFSSNEFNYELTPTLRLPSVGLGLTYFLK